MKYTYSPDSININTLRSFISQSWMGLFWCSLIFAGICRKFCRLSMYWYFEKILIFWFWWFKKVSKNQNFCFWLFKTFFEFCMKLQQVLRLPMKKHHENLISFLRYIYSKILRFWIFWDFLMSTYTTKYQVIKNHHLCHWRMKRSQ